MRSFVARLFIVAAVLVAWHGVPSESDAALREASGKRPKFTARLSSNPVIRKHQLIVDPEGIIGGSVSVRYDPTVVSLSGVLDPADFQITGGFVSVLPASWLGDTGGGSAPIAAAMPVNQSATKAVPARFMVSPPSAR